MKIIDLLNKIAKGEDVPHFKINKTKYCLDWKGSLVEYEEGKPSNDVRWFIYQNWLNKEVEIIGDDMDKYKYQKYKILKEIKDKINEIIDKLNEMSDK